MRFGARIALTFGSALTSISFLVTTWLDNIYLIMLTCGALSGEFPYSLKFPEAKFQSLLSNYTLMVETANGYVK